MVLGWRRPFCASIPRDLDSMEQAHTTPQPSPRFGSKFGFFSNPSTPRMHHSPPPESTPSLRCRTTVTPPADSPKHQSKSPRFFHRSQPSSPRSPSPFSLLKSSLRLSKSRCGICSRTVKSGQGTAIFTAECSHSFHFPCVAAHVKKQGSLICPICCSTWKELPVLSLHDEEMKILEVEMEERTIRQVTPKGMKDVRVKSEVNDKQRQKGRAILKVYNDDEPLMSPTSGARFNPIPESDEENEEFQGFFYEKASPVMHTPAAVVSNNVEATLLPEAAVVSVGRSQETHAVVLRLRAPPASLVTSRKAPIDLVAVLDVSGKMTTDSIQVMRRAMRLVVSSLSATDRLSIVAFSATSKRLLPLRRMTTSGRRSARRIVDAMVSLGGAASAIDALKKAAKVLEDRRERNSAASILLLSDCHYEQLAASSVYQRPQSPVISSSKLFGQNEIPVYSVALNDAAGFGSGSTEDGLTKCIGGLLNVVAHDLRVELKFVSGSAPAEVAAVYSNGSRPVCHGSGHIRLGDFYAEEERELMVELKVPSSATGAHHALSIRSVYKDPSTQDLIHCKEQALLVPRAHAVRSSSENIRRLRNLFVSTRAVAESRRLADRSDFTGARRMLSSARALLMQSNSGQADDLITGLEAELSELHRTRQNQQNQIQRRGRDEEKGEPLTPTSAWRAAEMLAKVAMMRKSLNRVSDLHGFEDARF
ncbi:unnamed protein product [Cuscuta europaea]|uniref:Uncharacterized protein n=1 Tax=Cuscuta europaea TaxID=41803 RepID=A0A9P0ZNX1_CUSEU|nr:unnamed protein product [Cuscuta europaea]